MANAALESALSYAGRGWSVFPLRPKSKRPPAGFEWRKNSTTDEAKIREWAKKLPGCNFGVDCGKSGLAIIDVDVKHEGADEALIELSLEHDLPDTMVVNTPSGGRHLYYTGSVKNSVQKLGVGLDTRGEGGYVVIPGSTVDEEGVKGSYTVSTTRDTQPIPDSIVHLVGQPKERTETTALPAGDLDLAHNIAMFVQLMQNHGPVMEGERNRATYLMAASARDCGLSLEMAVELMKSTWIPMLEGDFTVTELIRTVDSAYKTAHNVPGCETPEAMFPDDLPEATTEPKPEEDFIWSASGIELSAIPPREWIVGTRAIAGFVDVLIAPGGMSKSTFLIAECMAIVTGKPLTGDDIHRQGPCWLLNGEDPKDEMQRRVVAAAQHHGIPLSDLEGLYLSSGYGRDFALISDTGRGISVNHRLVERIITRAKELGIVRIVLDPLVRFHRADENDNMALDRLMQVAAKIAKETGAAVSIAHHTRKRRTNGDEGNGDADTARGASSVVSAARIAHTMGGLGPKEAKKLGISEAQRKWYVRVDDAKSNLAPPAAAAKWFKRVSIELPNGDKVGVLEVADVSFVEELEASDIALLNAVHDVVSTMDEDTTVYRIAKEIVDRPAIFPEVQGTDRTIRRRISELFTEPVEVCGAVYKIVERKGRTGKPTEVIVEA